jgi:hypothetical protein
MIWAVNPNWTRWGQSWLCQLWPQIVGKHIKYFISFLNTYLFQQKCLPNLFKLLTWPQKITFWHIFVRSLAVVGTPPPFRSVLLTLQTSRGREKSGTALVRIPICFWSWAVENEGGGLFSVGPALPLFLNGPLALQWFRQVPETNSFFSAYTLAPSWTVIFQFRPHFSLAIGPNLRSNFTSIGPWHALRLPVRLGLSFEISFRIFVVLCTL